MRLVPWWLAFGWCRVVLRALAAARIRWLGCTRYQCDTCKLINGCPMWGRPKR